MATVSATTDIPDALVVEVRTALEEKYPRRPGEAVQAFLNRIWRLHLREIVLQRRAAAAQWAALQAQQAATDTDLPEG